MKLFTAIKKLCLEPGVLFPIANVFVFAQTHNKLALSLAIANVFFSMTAAFHENIRIKPLRVTAWMLMVMVGLSFWNGSLLPGLAGLCFGIGHFVITSDKMAAIAHSTSTRALQKVLTHPAVYYGLGSVTVGVMAGGGLELLHHPLDNQSPLIMVSCGVVAILAASFGLALNLFKSNIPFWILASGVAINALAGLVTGNLLGSGNCFFAMCGYLRLGWINAEKQQSK